MERDRLIRLQEVAERTGLSKRMIYRLIQQGRFPIQFKPGGYSSRWSEQEVEAWVRQQRTVC
jgi:prophage regulatory protein